ncbi:MAG: hypothetical protein M3R27_10945 [Bacteroidota bacterium]|nr:hypothetical protein [Bacteroidota bacterium]
MKNLLLTVCILSSILFSCRRIIYYAAGVREPQEETKESLQKFTAKYLIDTNDLYQPKDTSAFLKLNKISSVFSGYAFFDKNKEMLMYKDTGSACSAPVILFSQSICERSHMPFYKSYSLSLITDKIKPLNNIKYPNKEEYDFYACIFWYKYLGKKKFQSDIADIVKSLKSNNCKIKIYLINLDLQSGWKKQIPIKIK